MTQVPVNKAPSLRELHGLALRMKLMLSVLDATVDIPAEENLNLSLVESALRLARRLDEALDQAAG